MLPPNLSGCCRTNSTDLTGQRSAGISVGCGAHITNASAAAPTTGHPALATFTRWSRSDSVRQRPGNTIDHADARTGAVTITSNGILRPANNAKYVHKTSSSPSLAETRGRQTASVTNINASHARNPSEPAV